jgi:hypothetical protein
VGLLRQCKIRACIVRFRRCFLHRLDQHSPVPLGPLTARLGWVFAKTMPEWPHEYSVRRKARDEADYVALWHAIMTDGIIMCWRGRPGLYLYPGDGWRYWDLTPKLHAKLEHSRHINRCKVEEVERLRGLGLVTDWHPEVMPKPALTYTRRFARVFQTMLAPQGYEMTISPDQALVIFENKSASIRVEIVNPRQHHRPGGRNPRAGFGRYD